MALLTIEKIIFLNSVSIFKTMRAEDLSLVANITKEEDYGGNETIFKEGDAGDKLFIVVNGEVALHKRLRDGSDLLLAVKTSNGVFGEMALFDDEPRSATAHCQKQSTLLTLDKNDLIELIYDYPNLSFGIIKGITIMLREANQRYVNKS